jgi:hypothetical protein
VYKVEPVEAVFACNLFTKNNIRSALADEVVEGWPEMPLVSKPSAFACRAERLAGARSCPDGSVVCPSCAAQGVRPHPNSCEEVTLGKSFKVVGGDIFYTPFIDHAVGNVALFDQFSQPRSSFLVKFVVVCGHCGLTFGNGDTLGAFVSMQWTPITSKPCASNTSRSVLMLLLQA